MRPPVISERQEGKILTNPPNKHLNKWRKRLTIDASRVNWYAQRTSPAQSGHDDVNILIFSIVPKEFSWHELALRLAQEPYSSSFNELPFMLDWRGVPKFGQIYCESAAGIIVNSLIGRQLDDDHWLRKQKQKRRVNEKQVKINCVDEYQ